MKYLLIALCACALFACQEPAPKQAAVQDEPVVDHLKLGQEISAIAQAELMKSVQTGLKEGGPAFAIKHCNIHATPLTDSLSQVFNCRIQRVSLRNRNPENAPENADESMLLNAYLEASLDAKSLKDTLVLSEHKTIYYRPITIGMEACLKCHGQLKEDVSDETLTAIYTLYPGDKATNYRLGDFRGAWKISFN